MINSDERPPPPPPPLPPANMFIFSNEKLTAAQFLTRRILLIRSSYLIIVESIFCRWICLSGSHSIEPLSLYSRSLPNSDLSNKMGENGVIQQHTYLQKQRGRTKTFHSMNSFIGPHTITQIFNPFIDLPVSFCSRSGRLRHGW